MFAPARSMLTDELQSVVSALCARFPTRQRSDVETVVADVYEQLAGSARITAHLIPLTLNRSRRLLEGTQGIRISQGLLAAWKMTNAPRG